MKQLVRSLVVVVALMVPLAVFAAEDKLFTNLDADKNGTVSKDELLKADLHVVTTPKGQKQVVHRDMLKAETAAAMTEEQKKRLFDQVDTDKSGHISKKEWGRASQDGLILLKF